MDETWYMTLPRNITTNMKYNVLLRQIYSMEVRCVRRFGALGSCKIFYSFKNKNGLQYKRIVKLTRRNINICLVLIVVYWIYSNLFYLLIYYLFTDTVFIQSEYIYYIIILFIHKR